MTEKRKEPLVILTGPTAVGKTKLSIALAKAIGGEIIWADSMQVYRHMDIGSAKIRPEEMRGVRHHLIDCYEPWEEFHVVEFQRAAKAAMEDVWSRGHLPVLTGGTGFYIQALVRDIDFTETGGDPAYRAALERLAEERGADYLHGELMRVDPAAAEEIHPPTMSNGSIRALEYFPPIPGSRFPFTTRREKEKRIPLPFCLFCAKPG